MSFQPPYRPSGRSIWLGKDLVRTDDWIVRLSPATLERGLDFFAISDLIAEELREFVDKFETAQGS